MNQAVIEWLNALPTEPAHEQMRKCCGAEWWINRMIAERPFSDAHETADRVFDAMPSDAWLEAFACHPKIGDLESLRMKFSGNKQWSAGEQAGVAETDERTLVRLAEGNEAYLERFGYIFIVCASGKSAAEMLALLEARLGNAPDDELPIAAVEQRKITHLRLDKLTIEEG